MTIRLFRVCIIEPFKKEVSKDTKKRKRKGKKKYVRLERKEELI